MNQQAYYLSPKQIVTPAGIMKNRHLLIKNGLISEITDKPQKDIPIHNIADCTLAPGFLDLHIHGREGCDVMDASRESLEVISRSLARHGIVGFLATTVTDTWPKTLAAFNNIGEAYSGNLPGAELLGAYNEGLFFTKDHKGAHDEQYFLPLDKKYLDAIITAANGALKVVALAPELPNSDEIIRYLSSKNIKTMLGHTAANYEQTCSALHAGACGGVHVFNGMSGIHHRDPGCAGAVLLDKNAYVEVIADGIHLHPAILDMIVRLKGQAKVGLISDCIVAGGMCDGQYKLGMLDVTVEQGIARTQSGSLAGSTLTLEKAVKNMFESTQADLVQVIEMASLSPATFLGLDKELGSIEIGKRACLTALDPHFNITMTIVDGRIVYSA
ncbi:N-acetylglucosamine-6-phosphate deacetylase [Neptunicella sp. SCSIO 80796]|uniref:N-acetylglucosamine-6-phosphate deacetylase n=1 Tax=Neptunicella plasticusilytica TaxID=3117012 RepID=UPI003A4E0E3D